MIPALGNGCVTNVASMSGLRHFNIDLTLLITHMGLFLYCRRYCHRFGYGDAERRAGGTNMDG